MKMKENKFYPDIYDHLEQINYKEVNVSNLEEIGYKIYASTNLDLEVCHLLVKMYFQEIRNIILRGDTILISNFGKFILSTPKTTNNKNRVFPKFIPYKSLIKKLNVKNK